MSELFPRLLRRRSHLIFDETPWPKALRIPGWMLEGCQSTRAQQARSELCSLRPHRFSVSLTGDSRGVWEFFLSNFHQSSKHRFTEKCKICAIWVAIDFVTKFKEMAGVQLDFVHLPDLSCAKLGSAFNFFSKHQAMEIDAKNRLHAVCYDAQRWH